MPIFGCLNPWQATRLGNHSTHMTTSRLSPQQLHDAVKQLFVLNHYRVQGPLHIHGAEVDLVASLENGVFESNIYVEITTEYVNTTKYGKDVTKFITIREVDREAKCIIVSQAGFTPDVIERAKAARVHTMTYDELFAQFSKFDKYVSRVTEDGRYHEELSTLHDVYEEPVFDDKIGKHLATDYLLDWRNTLDHRRWLIVVGEYGTGKTALTKVLQYRWIYEYKYNASIPIVFRIELRNFVRQFDERSLIHKFLDDNGLGHVSLEFVMSLIRSGKILLLLDGYDEMAQYMHPRERRACLEALAALSAEGARGILTSRPNYFSEAEEFQVFEVLYRSVVQLGLGDGSAASSILDKEKRVDELLESHFFSRHERIL